jgi:hypothetical protein
MDQHQLDEYLGGLTPSRLQTLQGFIKAEGESILSDRVEKWRTEHCAGQVNATVPNSPTIAPPVPDAKDSAPPSSPVTPPVPAHEHAPKRSVPKRSVLKRVLRRSFCLPHSLFLAMYRICTKIPRWSVFLMLVVTGIAGLLFLAGLAGGPALEAVPVPTSSNSTGPDNTTNATSVAVRLMANRVVAISDGLRQFLQLSCTADINVAVVSLSVYLQPVFQRFLPQLGVQRREPRRQRQTHGDKNGDFYFWPLLALGGLTLYWAALVLCP